MSFKIISNKFPQIAAALKSSEQDAKDIIGSAAVTHIQEHITANGQIETGYMLDSVEYDGDSTVSVGADYAIYQNYGTRYLPARPFFEPGLDDTNGDVDSSMRMIASKMESV